MRIPRSAESERLRKQTLHARLKRGWSLERAFVRDIAAKRTAQPPLADWIGADCCQTWARPS